MSSNKIPISSLLKEYMSLQLSYVNFTNYIENKVKNVLKEHNNKVDIILSHTCPFKYMPYEAFISGIDQSMVDNSTEKFLDETGNNTSYEKWYCGLHHIDKSIDSLRFMMNDIDKLI